MVSTFIRKWKILLRYCYFWHTERLKNFCQEFYLLQKWKTSNFPNLSQVRAPISDSFILFRKLFKVIFFLKLSPKCLGNTLKLFKTSWFIQNLDDFWLCVKKYGRQMASLNIAHFFDISLLAWKNVSKKEAKNSYIWRCNNNKKSQWFNLHTYCILHKLLVLLNWKHCIKMIIPTSYLLQQSINILRRKKKLKFKILVFFDIFGCDNPND